VSSGTWSRWRLLRRAVQGFFLALFLILTVLSVLGVGSATLGSFFLWLDPLAGLTAMLSARRFLPRFLPAVGLVLFTLALGRAWCGWFCPLGTLLEWAAPRRTRRPLATAWRWVKYGLLLTLVAGALWSSQGLLLLDPLPLLQRGVVALLRPALDPLRHLAGPASGHFRAADLWPALLLAAVVALNAVAPRFWCRALCPLGALLGFFARLAALRRRVDGACDGCGACARRCPQGAIEQHTWESDPGECVTCLACAELCPQDALRWRFGPRGGAAFMPSRRALLASMGAGLLAGGLLRLERLLRQKPARLLRPPGAREEALLAQCVRCGACVAACPTGVLRPALFEAGVEGLGTPLFLPRQGYCRYTCHACGQACPSGAVPALSLEEKQVQVIGIARVDPARCLVWKENRRCTVCRDTCPLPGPALPAMNVPIWGRPRCCIPRTIPYPGRTTRPQARGMRAA